MKKTNKNSSSKVLPEKIKPHKFHIPTYFEIALKRFIESYEGF